MDKSREELEKEYAEATAKLEQYQHRGQRYPAIIVDSHAEDPDVDDDDYKLTIVMDNGEETDLVVTEKVYEMAMNGEPLEICHRESPFGVVFLGIHMPSTE